MSESHGTGPRVAFQGEPGAFSEEAVLTYFNRDAVPIPCRQFSDVAEAVQHHECDAGLLPIENSTVGGVSGACDVLALSQLQITGEVICLVRHCLLARPGTAIDNVRRVLSHPVALGQCETFFRQNPHMEAVATYDTAGAARLVAESRDPDVAAIASRTAAERYGLAILLDDLQDRSDNQTRFLVVAARDPDRAALQASPVPAGAGKTALLLETENRPGALAEVLQPLALHQINLTHLQARPGRTPWSYWFFMEIAGAHASIRAALDTLAMLPVSLHVLGHYRPWLANNQVGRRQNRSLT